MTIVCQTCGYAQWYNANGPGPCVCRPVVLTRETLDAIAKRRNGPDPIAERTIDRLLDHINDGEDSA